VMVVVVLSVVGHLLCSPKRDASGDSNKARAPREQAHIADKRLVQEPTAARIEPC
jgi:hypothetical protein